MNLTQLNQGIATNAFCYKNLRQALKNKNSEDLNVIKFSHFCQMGKWLNSLTATDPTNPDYHKLVSLHDNCHQTVFMALDRYIAPVLQQIVIDGKVVPPPPTLESLSYDLAQGLGALKANQTA